MLRDEASNPSTGKDWQFSLKLVLCYAGSYRCFVPQHDRARL